MSYICFGRNKEIGGTKKQKKEKLEKKEKEEKKK
jgi:hypothetical protein